jgi:hypothetical protein
LKNRPPGPPEKLFIALWAVGLPALEGGSDTRVRPEEAGTVGQNVRTLMVFKNNCDTGNIQGYCSIVNVFTMLSLFKSLAALAATFQ